MILCREFEISILAAILYILDFQVFCCDLVLLDYFISGAISAQKSLGKYFLSRVPKDPLLDH